MTEILLFAHVLAVIIWVGGGFMLQFLLARAKRSGPDAVSQLTDHAAWTSNHIFMPASLAALVFGIATTVVGGYDFADLWISLGFLGFAASAVIGMAVLGPTSKRLKAIAAERGPNDPVVTHLSRRIDLFGRIDLVILVLVVLDMVVKPGLG